jgi:ATP-binding cassette subfamily B protein
MKKILFYLKPYTVRMIIGFLIKVAGTFMDLGLPWVLAYIIDDVIPVKNVSLILMWGIVMLFLSIGARTCNINANRMASRVAGDTVKKLRHDLFWKIEHLSGAQVDHYSIPSLISRMTSDTYNIHQMVSMMQRLGVRAPIIVIGGIIITSTLEPALTLVLLAILPLIAFVVYIVSKKGIPLYSQNQSAVDRMIRTVRENISGIRIIKALSKTGYEKKRFSKINDEVIEKELQAGMTMAVINPMMNLLLNAGLTIVVVVGAYRVNSGASEVGKIVAFLSYFTMILNAVLMINKIFVILSKATSSASRISEVLSSEEDLKVEKPEDFPPSQNRDEYHIEFNQVSFNYNNSRKELTGIITNTENIKSTVSSCLVHISFQIRKGELLGIIGSTGSGKTTIINLLMRFYEVDEGAIYINGKNIKTIPVIELRKKFGAVFQNDTIFADTINENINLNRGLSEERIKQAAQDAQAQEFIEQLVFNGENQDRNGVNSKYDYSVTANGTNLSGGQKQRILISRALADNPEILVLDDSSSALDYKTDSELRRAIRNNYKDTTIIMIAQRISSIMHMDHILVLEEGEMIGYGNHKELLESCSVYQEIYHSQIGIDS